jgi:hypothetical protein
MDVRPTGSLGSDGMAMRTWHPERITPRITLSFLGRQIMWTHDLSDAQREITPCEIPSLRTKRSLDHQTNIGTHRAGVAIRKHEEKKKRRYGKALMIILRTHKFSYKAESTHALIADVFFPLFLFFFCTR